SGAAPAHYGLVAAAYGIFLVYALALPELGFRLATVAFVAALSALLDPPRRPAHWLRVAVLAFATALVAWLVFERYLDVLLPRGRWTDF
ncbi:MAG: tripartite tricarboxylate transporter TctB family protein, partial [Burkholderiales bacterium]